MKTGSKTDEQTKSVNIITLNQPMTPKCNDSARDPT